MTTFISKIDHLDPNVLLYDEWLVTNGMGGFACGSLCGAPMRKYHALLTAALPLPFGRTLMLNYAADSLMLQNQEEIPLSLIRRTNDEGLPPFPLIEFRLENGLPFWKYAFKNYVIEKNLFLIDQQNTLLIQYKMVSNTPSVQLKWRPYFHIRGYESPVNALIEKEEYLIHSKQDHYEIICPSFPPLKLVNVPYSSFTEERDLIPNVFYEISAKRGYESVGQLTSPGYFLSTLSGENPVTFMASTETWESIKELNYREAVVKEKKRKKDLLEQANITNDSPIIGKMVLAADQFIITPRVRFEDLFQLAMKGVDAHSIIAGYPWFTDWGRDAMISLEGLTLTTNRLNIADSILRTFAHYIKNGLIPNMFPDGIKSIYYNTADATLWFFHALDKYLEAGGNRDTLNFLLPKLKEIIHHHIKGTHFGIKMDADGLLTQGEKGFALTWMDAKMGDWVVTPRRGKTVEINALWYNALKLLETWTQEPLSVSQQCYESFNQRFWFDEGEYLYDVIDGENGNDSALRPNQLFAISLRFPVLHKNRWEKTLKNVQKELLTPFGLRTLSPHDPDFKSMYDGDLRARDASYHQGTVWPWLIGAFIDAWIKVFPDDLENPKKFLEGLESHIDRGCIGSIAEIFDATEPYHSRGCFAQAWSVAEFLRIYVKIHSD